MATIEGIITKLKEKKPEMAPMIQTIVKNTVSLTGLCLKTENNNVAPIVYIDKMLVESVSDEEAVRQIIKIINQNSLDLDINQFINSEYIRNNIYLGLQKSYDNCNYVTQKTPWEGIIKYMYVRLETDDGSSCSMKVTESLLKNVGIEISDAWKMAEKNTCDEIDIQSLLEVFREVLPDDEVKLCEYAPPFYIASNTLRLNGAAVVLNEEYIKQWAESNGFHKVVIIFSSIHEALLLPVDENEVDLETISNMMKEINDTQVSEIEQLADKAFVLNI